MSGQENKSTYVSILSSVAFKAALCAVAPKTAIKVLSTLGAQSIINSFDEQPTKPLFVVCILNVIGSDVTDLFERVYEDATELYNKYVDDDIATVKTQLDVSFQNESLVSVQGYNEVLISGEDAI